MSFTASLLRRIITGTLAVALLSAGAVVVDTQPAQANWACHFFSWACGTVGGGGNSPERSAPVKPPKPPDPPRTSNPAHTWSGVAYFNSPYGWGYSTFLGQPVPRDYPSGLPGSRGGFTANDGRGGTVAVRGNGDNHYRGQCVTEYRRIWNPVDEKIELFYPYGVRWVDRMFWADDGNSWRSVSYECLYPGAPRPVLKTCAYWGAGKLQGPLANSKGLPVVDEDGKVLTASLPRQWIAPRTTTTLGGRYDATGRNHMLGLSPAAFAGYVNANCSDFDYLGWFDKDNCTTLYGGERLSGNDCAVVPGNYLNKFRGQQLRCGWTYYPYWNFYRAKGCFTLGEFAQDRKAALYCKGRAPKGRGTVYNNWDTSYNFATCGDSFAPPRCEYDGPTSAPAVYAPGGERAGLSTQTLANGQQWHLKYPRLSVPGAENKRQQWILAGGSEPVNHPDPRHATQPFLAHYDAGATGRGVLVYESSDASYPGWNKYDLYLRLFKAGNVSWDGPTRVGQGEVQNPAKVAKGTIIPLGIYAKYSFTVKKLVTTEVAGPIEIDVPFDCRSSMATFYPVLGRAID